MTSSPAPRHTLAEEHADLLREVDTRRQRVLAALADGRWPQAEIDGLLGYLRYELLDQAVHEERLLYPLTAAGFTDERIRRLTEEHARLRDCADAVALEATAGGSEQDSGRLIATLDELHEQLQRHLHEEQEVLATATESGIEDLRRPFRSHGWFALTEGPAVNVDMLPKEFAVAAIMDRLTRLRRGESVELISRQPLHSLQELFVRRDLSADYGWAYLDEGPTEWRAAITRRQPPE